MTREEEIKEAMDKICEFKAYPFNRGFIAGALWADEHPKYNQEQLMQELNDLQFAYDGKCAEVERLRNPLISVEDKLPYKGQNVIARIEHIIRGGGEEEVSESFLQMQFSDSFPHNCEQTRNCGVLYDMITRTTHWMPTPELEGGEK